ncbi:protein of unknown function [Candidatus Hydrogenisulfobacillus filiaventi]|uniref:Uncharacterized protein n=1 Tax=Candidatus Hydrogenisulfobacillus filiaventi TaxID=2707344 RepID=A0A6F8ZDT4_9FIRM|nr:protein of unknown function [Candidatus Hydrogenisulfobacillus filiaventi]
MVALAWMHLQGHDEAPPRDRPLLERWFAGGGTAGELAGLLPARSCCPRRRQTTRRWGRSGSDGSFTPGAAPDRWPRPTSTPWLP